MGGRDAIVGAPSVMSDESGAEEDKLVAVRLNLGADGVQPVQRDNIRIALSKETLLPPRARRKRKPDETDSKREDEDKDESEDGDEGEDKSEGDDWWKNFRKQIQAWLLQAEENGVLPPMGFKDSVSLQLRRGDRYPKIRELVWKLTILEFANLPDYSDLEAELVDRVRHPQELEKLVRPKRRQSERRSNQRGMLLESALKSLHNMVPEHTIPGKTKGGISQGRVVPAIVNELSDQQQCAVPEENSGKTKKRRSQGEVLPATVSQLTDELRARLQANEEEEEADMGPDDAIEHAAATSILKMRRGGIEQNSNEDADLDEGEEGDSNDELDANGDSKVSGSSSRRKSRKASKKIRRLSVVARRTKRKKSSSAAIQRVLTMARAMGAGDEEDAPGDVSGKDANVGVDGPENKAEGPMAENGQGKESRGYPGKGKKLIKVGPLDAYAGEAERDVGFFTRREDLRGILEVRDPGGLDTAMAYRLRDPVDPKVSFEVADSLSPPFDGYVFMVLFTFSHFSEESAKEWWDKHKERVLAIRR